MCPWPSCFWDTQADTQTLQQHLVWVKAYFFRDIGSIIVTIIIIIKKKKIPTGLMVFKIIYMASEWIRKEKDENITHTINKNRAWIYLYLLYICLTDSFIQSHLWFTACYFASHCSIKSTHTKRTCWSWLAQVQVRCKGYMAYAANCQPLNCPATPTIPPVRRTERRKQEDKIKTIHLLLCERMRKTPW